MYVREGAGVNPSFKPYAALTSRILAGETGRRRIDARAMVVGTAGHVDVERLDEQSRLARLLHLPRSPGEIGSSAIDNLNPRLASYN